MASLLSWSHVLPSNPGENLEFSNVNQSYLLTWVRKKLKSQEKTVFC